MRTAEAQARSHGHDAMLDTYDFTRHARDRSTARAIPPMVAEIILEYGQSCDAGHGARKYALTRDSMRNLRRRAGPELTKALERYRTLNAYVVATAGQVITCAYAPKPLFR
jgi:hypothetical protein